MARDMPFRKACASGAPPCCAVCEQKSLPPESLRKDFERDRNESQPNRRLFLSHVLFTHKIWLSRSASLPDLAIPLDSARDSRGCRSTLPQSRAESPVKRIMHEIMVNTCWRERRIFSHAGVKNWRESGTNHRRIRLPHSWIFSGKMRRIVF